LSENCTLNRSLVNPSEKFPSQRYLGLALDQHVLKLGEEDVADPIPGMRHAQCAPPALARSHARTRRRPSSNSRS